MLPLHIGALELFDESTGTFIYTKPITLTLEHSLIAISKWESKWQKSFIHSKDLSREQSVDYVKCMVVSPTCIDENIWKALPYEILNQVAAYIDNPMTATTINGERKGGGSQIVTSELIYYWMITHNIPFECQKWHINRLLMLIKICNVNNNPGKKMSKREVLSRNAELNAKRKAQLGTTG